MKRDGVDEILKRFNQLERNIYFNSVFNCVKHNLASDPVEYAKDTINGMSNADLLEIIGDGLQKMLDQLDIRFEAMDNKIDHVFRNS